MNGCDGSHDIRMKIEIVLYATTTKNRDMIARRISSHQLVDFRVI